MKSKALPGVKRVRSRRIRGIAKCGKARHSTFHSPRHTSALECFLLQRKINDISFYSFFFSFVTMAEYTMRYRKVAR